MKKSILSSMILLLIISTLGFTQAGTGDYKVVTVRKGENIDILARRYLKSTRFKSDLLRYNHLKASQIRPGLRIKIPYSISKEMAAKVKFLKGIVHRKTRNVPWRTIRRSGSILLQNDIVKTGHNGMVELRFEDGSDLKIFKNSSISLKEYKYSKNGRKVNIRINKGGLFANVSKLKKGSRFHVSTVSAVVGVRGTSFYVSLSPRGATKVEVYKGSVAVTASRKRINLLAGYETTVEKGKQPRKPRKIKIPRKIKWLGR